MNNFNLSNECTPEKETANFGNQEELTPFKNFWNQNDQHSHQNLIKDEFPIYTPRKDRDGISRYS